MTVSHVFSSRQMAVVMQRLCTAMELTCNSMGDMSVDEYALLTAVAEIETGFSLRDMQKNFAGSVDLSCCVEALEKKELIFRVRSISDRRSFAIKVTQKGRARIALIDESLVSLLILTNERWIEEEFAYFVTRMHALSDDADIPRRIASIFSGGFLMFVCGYHQVIVGISALYGMTSLQTTILCAVEEEKSSFSLHRFGTLLNIREELLARQIDDLRKKELIYDRQCIELTEKGTQRVCECFQKLSLQIDQLFLHYPADRIALFEELGEYFIYLFI